MSGTSSSDDVPSYSASALSVLPDFHDCCVMIFVEGDDDIPFWNTICECANLSGALIESVGGCQQLSEKIERICKDDANVIVACDLDHTAFVENIPEHPLVVRTHGYSIENTMYCVESLNQFIRKQVRSTEDYTQKTQAWFEGFCAKSYRLLIYDIANHRYQKGVSVMGDSCARFLTSPQSTKISTSKVESFLSSISSHFMNSELEQCEALINADVRALPALIKGHFLTLGVSNWVKKQIPKKRPSISRDHLYTNTVDSCKSCIKKACPQLIQMCDAIKDAFQTIEMANQSVEAMS